MQGVRQTVFELRQRWEPSTVKKLRLERSLFQQYCRIQCRQSDTCPSVVTAFLTGEQIEQTTAAWRVRCPIVGRGAFETKPHRGPGSARATSHDSVWHISAQHVFGHRERGGAQPSCRIWRRPQPICERAVTDYTKAQSSTTGILAAASTVIPHLLNFPFDLRRPGVERTLLPSRRQSLKTSGQECPLHTVHAAWLRSLMRGYFRGQRELKDCTPTGIGGDPQAAAMRFDDGTADGQSHAGTLALGGIEDVKNFLDLLGL